jgi:hypothetical protein
MPNDNYLGRVSNLGTWVKTDLIDRLLDAGNTGPGPIDDNLKGAASLAIFA